MLVDSCNIDFQWYTLYLLAATLKLWGLMEGYKQKKQSIFLMNLGFGSHGNTVCLWCGAFTFDMDLIKVVFDTKGRRDKEKQYKKG